MDNRHPGWQVTTWMLDKSHSDRQVRTWILDKASPATGEYPDQWERDKCDRHVPKRIPLSLNPDWWNNLTLLFVDLGLKNSTES